MIKNKKKTKFYALLLLIGIAVAITLTLIIHLPYNISSYAEIFPREKWLLIRGRNGELISSHIDYSQGHANSYSISNIDRGEFFSLNLQDHLSNRSVINKGDTIAVMSSSNIQDQLIAALAQLEVNVANINAQKSPAKEALIREAEFRVSSSQRKIEDQKIIFERIKQLFQKGFSSQQEYDANKNALDLLELEHHVNEAALQNLKTGVKPEEIAYLESQVKAVKARIGYLRNRSNQLTLIAPFTGRLQPSFSPDTLLYMTNCSDAIVHLPIALTDAGEFTEGKKVNLHCPESELSFSGTIITLGKEVTIIDMRQVIYVSILVEDCDAILLPGMVLRCSLNTKSVSLAQYFYLKMK